MTLPCFVHGMLIETVSMVLYCERASYLCIRASSRQQQDEERNIENEMTKGAILYMKGIGGDTSREDIKNLLQDYGPIAWVDFNKGDVEVKVTV